MVIIKPHNCKQLLHNYFSNFLYILYYMHKISLYIMVKPLSQGWVISRQPFTEENETLTKLSYINFIAAAVPVSRDSIPQLQSDP